MTSIRIDYHKLRWYCRASFAQFHQFGTLFMVNGKRYIYKDNDSKLLGVAHLDTALPAPYTARFNLGPEKMFISPALDDRLGAYVLLEILPQLGIYPDILLTDLEEKGMSTGELFKTEKQYNWIFSFDRRGDDVVLYKYDEPELKRKLVDVGFRIGIGSFSDIDSIELGCSGINIGVGYYDEHTDMCHMRQSVLVSQISKFLKFYNLYAGTFMPFEEPTYNWQYNRYAYYPNSPTHISSEMNKQYGEIVKANKASRFCDYCGGILFPEETALCSPCARAEAIVNAELEDEERGDPTQVEMQGYCIYCGVEIRRHELMTGICDDCSITYERS